MFKHVKKLSSKLLIVFILVALLSSISGIVGAVILKNTDSSYSEALIDYGYAQGDLGRYGMIVNENSALIRDIVFLTDATLLNVAYNELEANTKELDTLGKKVEASNDSDKEKELYAKMQSAMDDYRAVRNRVIEYGMANNQDAAYQIWINEAAPLMEIVVADVNALVTAKSEMGTLASETLTKNSHRCMIIIVSIIVASAAISVFIAISMAKGISRPVIQVQGAAKQLSEGSLNFHVTTDLADEIGEMAKSFEEAGTMLKGNIADIARGLAQVASGNFNVQPNVHYLGDFKKIEESIENIIVSLSDTMGQINQAANQVATGSDQVASSAQALSQGATEQASSVQELSATINEISQQLQKTAENTELVKDETNATGEEISLSNRRMQDMIAAMNEISNKSSEIGKIIKTIEDIAFQTNILALNAAVEAARAGTAGKGFAVVADEVRNLAGKSAEAAKNTTALIEETVQAVANGTKIAGGTAEALQNVVTGSNRVASLINEIAQASIQQSNAVEQITFGVEQIASVVQNNSATAEESAAASEELSGQAQMLKELVSHFQLLERSTQREYGATSTQSMESTKPRELSASKY